jgi:4-amino-4-deoxy-L-arabinose transferase-like glycosyltransferase
VFVLLLLASRDYGYFFDEAYFVIAGRDHLAWGYFDQPPLVPFLAGLADRLFPGSLVALRFPVTLAAAGGVVLTSLIARDLGGRRPAQVLTATAAALTGTTVLSHYLATYSLDPFCWTLIVFLLVRWTRQRQTTGRANDWLLLAAGGVTAVSLETKFLVPALWAAVLVCALVFGPRDLVRRPALWVGLLVAAATTVPTLLWQSHHGWPYTRMQQVVTAEFPGTGTFLLQALLGPGLLIGVPLVLFGLGRLAVAADARPYRYLGAAIVLLVIAFLVSAGRSYYVYGLYALPLASGAVGLQRVRWPLALRWVGGVLVVASVLGWLVVLPVYPRSWAERMPSSVGLLLPTTARGFADGDVLLAELTQVMATTWQALPPAQRAHTAVMTDSYAFAAAVDLLGPAKGLPRAYSGHRGYYFFGQPPASATDVLFFGTPSAAMAHDFARNTALAPDFATLYTGRRAPWPTLWPGLRSQ